MPLTKSAKKSLRVAQAKTVHNEKSKIALSKALKKMSEKNISEVISIIDKAAKAGIIAKNKASRLKSQLMKKWGNGKVKSQNAKVKTATQKSKVETTKAKTKDSKIAKVKTVKPKTKK